MSIYYIKQKMFSLKDKYYVYDINREPVLQIEGSPFTMIYDRLFGNIFSIGHSLTLNNLSGETQFILKKKIGFWWKKYEMLVDNNRKALIKEHKNWVKLKMDIDSQYGELSVVTGDIMGIEFDIVQAGIKVAKVTKKFSWLGDCYEICVYDDEMENLSIAIVIAMDNCWHN